MKIKLFLFFILSIILLFSFGCSTPKKDEPHKESTPAITEDTTANTTVSSDTISPPVYNITTRTFTDIRTMKNELEMESKSLPTLKSFAD